MAYSVVPRFIAAATTAVTLDETYSGQEIWVADLTADCTFTLPSTPIAGMRFEFHYYGGASDTADWIIDAGSDTYYFKGGVTHLDDDAGTTADSVVPVYSDGNSNSKLTILTPDAGTRVVVVGDGSNWLVSGIAVSSTVPSFADQ